MKVKGSGNWVQGKEGNIIEVIGFRVRGER